jgi:hydrogenase expression/formation protein HypD
MIHGPGCPVCVLPIGRIDNAIELASKHSAIVCTYADTMRVPASPAAGPPQGGQHPRGGCEPQVSRGPGESLSLMKAKARGADIRMVYSAADALRIAQDNPSREVVFFAIGFETTTPPTAIVIRQAQALGLTNFTVFCNHVLTPAAITHILESPEVRELGIVPLDGFIGPAHVSTVIGSQPYEYFAEEYQRPVVIAGFEPLDVMQAILMLVRQLNDGRAEVENEFTRAVTREGNEKAKALVADVFELRRSFEWRGLGEVPYSALRIKEAYAAFDAERRFGIAYRSVADNKACECGAILRGVKKPTDCKVFGTVCTPENPIGSCMVSSEGACAAHYTYGRFKDIEVRAA